MSFTPYGEVELRMLRALEAALARGDKERVGKINTALAILREMYNDPPLDGIQRKRPE